MSELTDFKAAISELYTELNELDHVAEKGTGIGVICDAIILFGGALDRPAAAVFFDDTAIESYAAFILDDDTEITDSFTCSLAADICEAAVSIKTVLEG